MGLGFVTIPEREPTDVEVAVTIDGTPHVFARMSNMQDAAALASLLGELDLDELLTLRNALNTWEEILDSECKARAAAREAAYGKGKAG